jgi:hypothetical protein
VDGADPALVGVDETESSLFPTGGADTTRLRFPVCLVTFSILFLNVLCPSYFSFLFGDLVLSTWVVISGLEITLF